MKVTALEKVCFNDIQNTKTVFNTLTVHDKHYLLKRDNLTQPIQIQLSQEQNMSSEFFFAFLNSI